MTLRKALSLKIFAFLLVLAGILAGLNSICMPLWPEWNNFNTTRGFYEVPKNTIEVAVLGSSVSMNGINPMEFYKTQGIAAYNLTTEQQPVMGSYYWLREAYRLHSKTLKTAVFEVQMLMYDADDAFYRKAFDPMHLSMVKLSAIRKLHPRFSYLFPLYKYHSRWGDLQPEDFTKAWRKPETFRLGFNFADYRDFYRVGYEALNVTPVPVDQNMAPAIFDQKAVYYFGRMVRFCREKGINLVLVKTPNAWWNSGQYKAAKALADEQGLPYLDFNRPELYKKLGMILAFDLNDVTHMNYWGAKKLSPHIADYLSENDLARDVRQDSAYSWYKQQEALYDRAIERYINLQSTDDVLDFLDVVRQFKSTTTFISLRDEGVASLSDVDREKLRQFGYSALAALPYRASYLAIVKDGKITEIPGTATAAVSNAGITSDKMRYELFSAGFDVGNRSSIRINGNERSFNGRGLNIVIYDDVLHREFYRTCFDTFASHKRGVPVTEEGLKKALAADPNKDHLQGDLRKLSLYIDRIQEQGGDFVRHSQDPVK